MNNGTHLLPPCRAGSDGFAGRIYLTVSTYAQNEAHREIKKELEDLRTLYIPGHIITMKI